MPLTDARLRSLRARDKTFRAADARGLYIEISPAGSKLWRLKYRIAGKEKRISFGAYPEVSLGDARKRCVEARLGLEQGRDPALERKRAKATARFSAANSFFDVADEYVGKMKKEGKADTTIAKANYFLSLLAPAIGSMPVRDVDPQMLLASLRRLEGRGNYETAKKCRSFASRVFRYAVATGRASADPAALLQGTLITQKAKNLAAILDPTKLGELLRAIDEYSGSPVTRLALQVLPHVFVRPGELRLSSWSEFDLEHALWTVPPGRMKSRREHAVPLSPHVLGLLRELHAITGPVGFAFPAVHTSRRPMSENTINAALRRMGFSKEEVCAHGFRASASTLLNESGLWNPDAIEKALAHGPSNAVRGAYHRGLHWEERVRMSLWWSDFLEKQKNENKVSS